MQVVEFGKKQHPGSTELLFGEAHVHHSMGRLYKALDTLDAVARLEPYNPEVYIRKAGIYSQLRDYRRSIDHFRRAIELSAEGRDELFLDLAFEYENLEAYEQAIESLKKALAINPENEGVLYELAHCYELAGAHEAAVTYFRAFTDEHPYSFVAWYNLGNALAALERYTESHEALDLSLAIEERFTSAWFSKARNLLLTGDLVGAIDCYRETLQHDGPQAVTFSYIGECFEKMERYEQALIHYDQALALDPNFVDAWVGRGVVKDAQGRHKEAAADLLAAVRLAPENADARFFLAAALARARRYDEALAQYSELNRMEPGSLDGWMEHADLLLEVKGPDAALAKLRECAPVHKLTPAFRYRMVGLLLRTGRQQQAFHELEEALLEDYAGHELLLRLYPETAAMPQVVHLLELHRK
jgi:tetratricopeptide (TPR) repeat protein